MTISIDSDIRKLIYERLITSGSIPGYKEIGHNLGIPEKAAKERTVQMKIGKTLLVHPDTGELWMAGPFSATETRYRVIGDNATWWANCAWDMFGVATIVGAKVTIETTCTDCGDPWSLTAEPDRPPTDKGIVHFLLPARDWYKDIGFT